MKYHKITYIGRDCLGCNGSRTHSKILAADTVEQALSQLTGTLGAQEWPHRVQEIQSSQEATLKEFFKQQDIADELRKERQEKIRLNEIWKSLQNNG